MHTVERKSYLGKAFFKSQMFKLKVAGCSMHAGSLFFPVNILIVHLFKVTGLRHVKGICRY